MASSLFNFIYKAKSGNDKEKPFIIKFLKKHNKKSFQYKESEQKF